MAAAVAKVIDQPTVTDIAPLDGSHDDLTDGQ